MKTFPSKAKSIENLSVEVKTDTDDTSQSNFTIEDTQLLHPNNENLGSWEKITQQIKENVFFR